MEKQPNTEYVLSLSYGKDSIACLEAIKLLGYPLDRILHSEVWATDTIPADLPIMTEFKRYADEVIYQRYGIKVEHIHATTKYGEKLTYEKQFYSIKKRGNNTNRNYGFPYSIGAWCTSRLKSDILNQYIKDNTKNVVQYLGIASDEPERIDRHTKPNIIPPLVDIKWTEDDCRQWCEENNLLSPIYVDSTRGGCWFCHNQGADQLRLLRKQHPELWNILLKWDTDSPIPFKSTGRTVHDYDKRFQMEDDGLIHAGNTKFRWKQIIS